MARALKTKLNEASVADYLSTIEDEPKRADCEALVALMSELSGAPPKMWGASIVGFGQYHYKYATGREGDWMRIGFAPRKRDLTLYVMDGYSDRAELLSRLGKHKTGKSCLYIKRLSDIDGDVLRELITDSLASMAERYPEG